MVNGGRFPTCTNHRKLEEESLLRKEEVEDAKAHAAALERTVR